MKPTFFARQSNFRAWLKKNHNKERELLVGFYKKDSGKPSLTWPESVDEALCFGWIDGVRRAFDADSFTIRFTPRRPNSIWSAVNIRHVARLEQTGRMRAPGRAAFARRDEARSRVYAFENRPKVLAPAYARRMRANARAWTWFSAQPPWYRRTITFWVMSAKREETRERRLGVLISHCEREKALPPIKLPKARSVARAKARR